MRIGWIISLAASAAVSLPPSALARTQEPPNQTATDATPVTPPSCLVCPPPSYPDNGRKAKISPATVVLDVMISPQGRIVDIHIFLDPENGYAEKAVLAVKSWKFKPAVRQDGKPVSTRTKIEVTFHLYKQ